LLSALCALSSELSPLHAASDAIIGYNRTEYKPVSRAWDDGTKTWGDETLGEYVPGSENIPYIVKIYAPPVGSAREDERIKIVLNADGRLMAMVWDGNSWGNIQTLTTGLSAMINYQPFDGAYEFTRSSFVVVYGNGGTATTAGGQANWASWNGTSWITGRNLPAEPVASGQAVRWVRMEAQPKINSNRMLAVIGDNVTNGEIYGLWWSSGTAQTWGVGGWTNLTNGTALSNNIERSDLGRSWDLAFASSTGRAYVIAAAQDGATSTEFFRFSTSLDGAAWTAMSNTIDLDAGNNEYAFLKAAADPAPGSDKIIVSALTTNFRLPMAVISGNAWNYTSVAVTGAQSNQRPVFDVGFEAWSSQGFLVYALTSNPTPQYRIWTSGGGLGGASGLPGFGGASLRSLQLYTHKASSDVWVAGDNNQGQLMFARWRGDTDVWDSAATQLASYLSAGVGTAGASPTYPYSMAEGSIAYGKNDSILRYKTVPAGTNNWDNSDNAAMDLGNGAARYVKIVASPKENKKIMGSLDTSGKVITQVWNGSSWSSSETVTSAVDAANSRDQQRGFDIAYERNSGDALIVYSVNGTKPYYRTRALGAGSWSSELQVADWPGAGIPLWIRLEANPTESSNEIMLVGMDSNLSIFALVWNGSSWITASAQTLANTTAMQSVSQPFDVAYNWDDTNPHALVVFAESGQTEDWAFKVWHSTAQTWGQTRNGFDFDTSAAVPASPSIRWMKLATNRGSTNSNRIGMGIADNDADLGGWVWNAATQAWGNGLENADTGIMGNGVAYRSFDIFWQRSGGELVLIFSNNNTGTRHRAWNGTSWDSARADANTGAAVRIVQAAAEPNNPSTDEVFVAMTNASYNQRIYENTGTLFGASGLIANVSQPTLFNAFRGETGNPTNYEPLFVAYTQDYTPPTSTLISPVHNAHYQSLTTITGTASDGTGDNIAGLQKVQIAIQDLTYSTTYYSVAGSSWAESAVWNDATGTSPWLLNVPGGIWTSNRSYRIYVRAVDNVKNTQTTATQADIVFDTTSPTGAVVYPVNLSGMNGYYRSGALTTLSGTAGDTLPGSVQRVVPNLRREDGLYWSQAASNWVSGYVGLSTSAWTGTVWQSTFPVSASDYRCRTKPATG
jgi:hypothetical protein